MDLRTPGRIDRVASHVFVRTNSYYTVNRSKRKTIFVDISEYIFTMVFREHLRGLFSFGVFDRI